MENKEIEDKSALELPVQGSGNILAVERKKQNKTVEEMANELNLTVSQIRTIELDQTDGLPEPTYVRGYIRSYANLLELDPEQVLKNYLNPNWKQSPRLDEMPRGIDSADRPMRSGSKLRWFITLLVLVGIGAFLWSSGFIDSLLGDTSSPQIITTVENTNTDAINNEIVEDIEDANDVDLSDTVATEQFDTAEEEETIVPAVSTANELILNFTQTSWIDIRDSTDARLAYKSYVAGEELIVTSEGPMSVFIGNAEGVTVQYNGNNFDLSQYREGVYAKFVVKEKDE